jgi:hypothetical protein
MGWHGLSVHGTSVVPEAPGAGRLTNVGGVNWTDIVGYRRGWGNTFRGVRNSWNWFHVAVPTVNMLDHVAAELFELRVNFQTTGTAKVQSIHLWDAHVPLRAFDGLALAGDFRAQAPLNKNYFQFNPKLKLMNGALGVSVGVVFGAQDSDILFTTVYASFSTP